MRFKNLIEGRTASQTEEHILILSWLKRYGYHHCSISEDGVVNSPTSIDLTSMNLDLSTLGDKDDSSFASDLGMPQYTSAGAGNKLPRFGTIKGSFDAGSLGIKTLKGWFPHEIEGNCTLSGNALTSLEGGPKIVNGKFDVGGNHLTTFKGSPKIVGSYGAIGNKLSSFEGISSQISLMLDIRNNDFETLKDIHKYVKRLDGFIALSGNPIKSHVLGLLLIKDLSGISVDRKEAPWGLIVNKHLITAAKSGYGNDNSDNLIDCQHELIEAGYEELAQI